MRGRGVLFQAICRQAPLVCLATLFPLVAQNTPCTEVSPRTFIDQKLALWQHRLKLDDWHISVVLARRAGLKQGTLGGIRWDKGKKSAVMSLLDFAEYRMPCDRMLEDLEFTIVHELVHLELASLPRSEASRRSEEHAVNRLTEALLALDRRQ